MGLLERSVKGELPPSPDADDLDYYEPELIKFNNSLATLLPREASWAFASFRSIFAQSVTQILQDKHSHTHCTA